MTVSELIEELRKYDGDIPVITYGSYDNMITATEEKTWVYLSKDGSYEGADMVERIGSAHMYVKKLEAILIW
jgi:hypothetical protein